MSVVSHIELSSPVHRKVTDDTASDEPTRSKAQQQLTYRTYKNLLVICIAFFLQFTAFHGIVNLQSSLNTDANIGVNALSVIFACLIISSIFLPHPLMAVFGLKWTLAISQVSYVLFVAANYYPKAYVMYPAAVLVGLSGAPLWTSKCTYLTDTGSLYALENNIDKNVIVSRFFGIFFMFFQSAQILGNIISYVVLKTKNTASSINGTENNTYFALTKYQKCGADFSEQEYKAADVLDQIDRKTVDILCIIYVLICLCSMLIVIIFLDQRRTASRGQFSTMIRNSVKLLASTIKHLGKVDQLLVVPLTIWSGLEQSFLWGQFAKSFITCPFDATYIGLVFIAFGVCDSIGSVVFGLIVKLVGRWPCFVTATIINYALIIVMLVWRPSQDQIGVLFIVVGLWGVADAVWQTQINAFYGILFPDTSEAAFSNYRLWEAAGFSLFYLITPYIRVQFSLIILLAFLSVGIVGYALAEYRRRGSEKRNEC